MSNVTTTHLYEGNDLITASLTFHYQITATLNSEPDHDPT